MIWKATLLLIVTHAGAVAAPVPPVFSLEQIMSDPDWIGRAPERPYWSDDGRFVYYEQKREGEATRDLFRVDVRTAVTVQIADDERSAIDHPGGVRSDDGRLRVYTRSGDLYLKDLETGTARQLTRTRQSVSGVRFLLGDDAITYGRQGSVFVRELATGFEWQVADVRGTDDPDDKENDEDAYIDAQQERLFEVVRRRETQGDLTKRIRRERHDADPSRVPRPWYFGKKTDIIGQVLSPTADTLVVRWAKGERKEGRRDTMPEWVTEDGYVDTETVRPKVGTSGTRGERLAILDLTGRTRKDVDFSALPMITDDPLAAIKAANAKKTDEEAEDPEPTDDEADPEDEDEDQDQEGKHDLSQPGDESKDDDGDLDGEDAKPKPRPFRIGTIAFSDDGAHLLVQLFSLDNKDRWMALVDPATGEVTPVFHRRDDAWINRWFARAGWMPHSNVIYFVSEDTGYGHLSVYDVETATRRDLTSGPYEVSGPSPSRDGRFIYYRANELHPGRDEMYRVDVATGEHVRLTDLGGRNRFVMSPDERSVVAIHSLPTMPPDLWVQTLEPDAIFRRLSDTVSPAFRAIPWIEPEIVAVPSRHGTPIYARIYGDGRGGPPKPGVIFVHGAGYLQNAHQGWSRYFREFMFHSLLVERGFVVIDMDYRASAGYGRDWRTAIYRNMGEPELEDLQDGIDYLVQHRNVDRGRIGLYGGSYGGFVTLMAMFQKPDVFTCGAALRPVTDWAHYNDPYTANILNTPDVDPEAYERSSPIEFAAGLDGALLMCHGMLDDNVLFQDTVRLAQRLIELKKEDWEVAIYPVEPHGFREPESWLDEYRRILKLFTVNLGDAARN